MRFLEASFESIWHSCCTELTAAARSARHPWHLMMLASQGETFPELRAVVLRSFEPKDPALWFHTDWRSPKIQQFQRHSAVSLLLYNAEEKRQFRAYGRVILHQQNDITRQRWETANDTSRRCYLVNPAPSEAMLMRGNTLPEAFQTTVPSAQQAEIGYENFTCVECVLESADILQLNASGGERCRLVFDGKGGIQTAQWLAP